MTIVPEVRWLIFDEVLRYVRTVPLNLQVSRNQSQWSLARLLRDFFFGRPCGKP